MTTLERAKAGELLTPEELSELLKKPVKWIYEKRRPRCVNPIPATPMGRGSLRFRWAEIVSWLDSCRQKDAEALSEKRNSVRPTRKPAKKKSAVSSSTSAKERRELDKFAQEFFQNVEMIDGILQPSPND
jgi:hypothetical protein